MQYFRASWAFAVLLLIGCRGPEGSLNNAGTVGGGSGRLSVDVKNAPFGAYDAAFIRAVQERWFELLRDRGEHTGVVTIKALLRSDGQIINLTRTNGDVPEEIAVLCERAMLEPAPYAPWPDEMRRLIGSDVREIEFKFQPPR
jgi:hypothetical protein